VARPPKSRRVEFAPEFTYFKPAGIPKTKLEELVLNVEELEAIRLKDREGLEQVDCAERMHVSRATFQRILVSARNKIAEAIIEGKAIKIEGGNYHFAGKRHFRCVACEHEFAELLETDSVEEDVKCPKCKLRIRRFLKDSSKKDN
jgi:predicted DNA-binding protein (UPF0251 family)